MTTQEIPAVQPQAVQPRSAELTVRITAGTAVKLGFFGALGVALFSLIISVVLGALGLLFGAAFLPVLQQVMER